MYGLLYIVFILCAISVHEIGHALLMLRYGVEMEEICLLGFGPKVCSFKMRWLFEDTPVTIRLIPLGAFVEKKSDTMDMQGYEDRHIYSGGIAMNLLFAAALLLPMVLLAGLRAPIVVVLELVLVGLGLAILFLPRAAGVIVLCVGVASLASLVYALSTEPLTQSIGGPVAVFAGASKVDSLGRALFDGAFISFSLALINAVPALPLDGGHICMSYIRQMLGLEDSSVEHVFMGLSVVCFGSIVSLAFASDVLKYLW